MQMTRKPISLHMKKIISLIVLIAAFYMVVADGLYLHFGLEMCYQYCFNIGALVFVIPFSVYFLLGIDEEGKR